IAPPGVTQGFDLRKHCAAVDRDAARLAHPLEPGGERLARQATRRMDLPRRLANGLLHVAADHHLLMTGESDELGNVLQQALAPGAERRRRRLRRTEACHG